MCAAEDLKVQSSLPGAKLDATPVNRHLTIGAGPISNRDLERPYEEALRFRIKQQGKNLIKLNPVTSQ